MHRKEFEQSGAKAAPAFSKGLDVWMQATASLETIRRSGDPKTYQMTPRISRNHAVPALTYFQTAVSLNC